MVCHFVACSNACPTRQRTASLNARPTNCALNGKPAYKGFRDSGEMNYTSVVQPLTSTRTFLPARRFLYPTNPKFELRSETIPSFHRIDLTSTMTGEFRAMTGTNQDVNTPYFQCAQKYNELAEAGND